MADSALSSVRIKWDNLCRQPAVNRFHLNPATQQVSNQKGSAYSAQLICPHGKWIKGKKEIIFVPDVPGFVLQLASRFASQSPRPTKASIVKQTMNAYTGFTKEDLEALLGIAFNGILADQSQVGKGTIRPSGAPASLPPSIQVQHPLGASSVHQRQYSQPQLGRPRWPEGLRVRQSWGTLGNQLASKDRPSLLDLRLAADIASCKSVLVVVGAGISVAAGIPDFRSKDGLFAQHGRQVFSQSSLNTEVGVNEHQHAMGTLAKACIAALPTPFHHFLAMLAESGKLRRLWTYNVDELDTSFEYLSSNLMSNSKFPLTIQMHGGLRKTICTRCGLLEELVPAALMNPDPKAWHCTTCPRTNAEPNGRGTYQRLQNVVGRKKANIVMYDDPQGDPNLERSMKFLKQDVNAPRVDGILVVGLSAILPSVQQLVRDLGAKRQRKLFWINKVPPPKLQGFDKIFHTVALTDCQLFATHIMRSVDLDAPCFLDLGSDVGSVTLPIQRRVPNVRSISIL